MKKTFGIMLMTVMAAISIVFIGCASAPFVVSENEITGPFFTDLEVSIFDDIASARDFIKSEEKKFHDSNAIKGPTKTFNGYFTEFRGAYRNKAAGQIAIEVIKIPSESDNQAFVIDFLITSDTGTFLKQVYMLRRSDYVFNNNSIDSTFKIRDNVYNLKVPAAYTDSKMWNHIAGVK